MRGWALNWRADTKIMERICCHGVDHPDPDSVSFGELHGKTHLGVHGCDGCCAPPKEDLKNGDLVKLNLIYESLTELD
jgi:hypothetical protein